MVDFVTSLQPIFGPKTSNLPEPVKHAFVNQNANEKRQKT